MWLWNLILISCILCEISPLLFRAKNFRTSLFHDTRLLSTRLRSLLSTPTAIDFVVDEEHSRDVGKRLDAFLSTLKGIKYSRSYFASLCEQGKVLVNNKTRSKSYRVEKGDHITFEVEDDGRQLKVEPEKIPLDIIFEDEDMIAINKPAGMVVHPAPGTPTGTFVNALIYHLGSQATELLLTHSRSKAMEDEISDEVAEGSYFESIEHSTDQDNVENWQDIGQDGDDEYDGEYDDIHFDHDDDEDEDFATFEAPVQDIKTSPHESKLDLPETPEAAQASPSFLRPGIVHRLDKGTTGVLLAGKHPLAVEKLASVFAQRKIEKTYLAICVGFPGDTSINKFIGRSSRYRQLMNVCQGAPGKHAISHIKTIAFDGKLSVCLVRIETGR